MAGQFRRQLQVRSDPELPPGFPDGIVESLWVTHSGFDGYTIVGVNAHTTVLDRLDGAEEVAEFLFRHGDRLTGSNQSDRLYGFGGHDVLKGRGDIDKLYGGHGDDRLDAGSGSGHLYGGEGEDTFIFTKAATLGFVEDFEKGDRINLTAFNTTFGDLVLREHRGNIVIDLSENHRIEIAGDVANLRADDFVF